MFKIGARGCLCEQSLVENGLYTGKNPSESQGKDKTDNTSNDITKC